MSPISAFVPPPGPVRERARKIARVEFDRFSLGIWRVADATRLLLRFDVTDIDADRAVQGAQITALTANGSVATQVSTDNAGEAQIELVPSHGSLRFTVIGEEGFWLLRVHAAPAPA